jgi:hypothetical protein
MLSSVQAQYSRLCPIVSSFRYNSSLESYVMTDGQSASLSWNKARVWGLRSDFYYCQTVTGLSIWGALSDERTGLSFTTYAGPHQRSHSRVPVVGTRDHILLSQVRDFPFRHLIRLAGLRWRYSIPPSHGILGLVSSCLPYNLSARSTVENPVYSGTSFVARGLLPRESILFPIVAQKWLYTLQCKFLQEQ